MRRDRFHYVYGPVSSWRLGSSLGIDPISSRKKVCSFDCIYCQLGRTKAVSDTRRIFVSAEDIISELNALPPLSVDYITFSGAGEPTLADNVGQMMRIIKKVRKEKIAVITNASLMDREDVQNDLLSADYIIAKLDASSQEVFEVINRPPATITFETVVKALKDFKKIYTGKIALQIMMIEENKAFAQDIAAVARSIGPHEIQLNTPLRPCAIAPLRPEEMRKIKAYFGGMSVVSVYESKKKKVTPISGDDTLKRRGKTLNHV
ncbi:MAG: radical SAM protein [Candidatus Omnitrophica bacterium]|nr:radical SAM protein [Candidatus Omnitrophota bacterium]